MKQRTRFTCGKAVRLLDESPFGASILKSGFGPLIRLNGAILVLKLGAVPIVNSGFIKLWFMVKCPASALRNEQE